MIIYYSSTGNSKHVADRLGEALNLTPIDLCKCEQAVLDLQNQDLYFVTFCCFWGVSEKVIFFLEHTEFRNVRKIFFIMTCGGSLGGSDRQINTIFAKKSLPTPLIYEIQMVTNYSVLHNIPDLSEQRKMNLWAETTLQEILTGRAKTYHSSFFTSLIQPFIHLLYKKYQTTKPFTVDEACISCGICDKHCPSSAINLVNGKPTWVKMKCDHCLRCLHHCLKRQLIMVEHHVSVDVINLETHTRIFI